jgi:hypothetical protein
MSWNIFTHNASRYNKAREIRDAQDTYCEKLSSGPYEDLGPYPEDLQWESLVDVLRGKVTSVLMVSDNFVTKIAPKRSR